MTYLSAMRVNLREMPRNCMLHACVVLFRLSAPADERAVGGIPKFRCEATPVIQRHAQRLLHVLTKHLVGTDARILRNLPDFIGVLRALPPLCLSAAVSPTPQTLSEASGVNPIAMLNHHVQKLEKKLGPVVPVDCLFWLGILQSEKVTSGTSAFSSSLSCLPVGEEEDGGEVRNVPRWNPEAFVISNDVMNTREATAQLDRIVLQAIERAASHDAEKKLSSSLRCQLLPCIIEALAFLLHHCWHAQPPLTVILAAAGYALHSLDVTPGWVLGENAMEIIAAFQTIFCSFHVRHTVAELAVLAHPAHRLSSAVDTVLSRTAYEGVRYVHDFILLASAWMQRCLHAAESEERRVLDEFHVHFMIRLVGNLVGTCASWPESSLRKESLRQLRLSCEMMERFVNAGKTAPLSSTALLLLRVMSTFLRNGPVDDDAVEAHFVGVTAISKVHISGDVNVESPPAGNAALSDLFLAITLLHIVRHDVPSSIRLVRAFLPALQLEESLQTLLSDDEAFVGGIVAMQSARLNAIVAVRRAFSMSLSAATRFIARLVELFPILSVDALTAQWLRSEEQLVEVAVFAALAACRNGEASDENDIVGAMDAVGTLVPHRWDLTYAIAFECPLTATPRTSSIDFTLRSRLAFLLQCCGPWPGGIVLTLLLQASWPAVSGEKDDGILSNYSELLDVMANLSVDKRLRMIPITPLPKLEASLPLMRFVALCHRQASTAACIILGNATPQEQDPQRRQKGRWGVWKALSTSDGAVQFIAIAYLTAPLSETRSTLHERQQLLADMTSWLSSSLSSSSSSSSSFSWPWRSLCLEARQLLLWSRVTFTFPQWESVNKTMHEPMTEEKRMIAAAMSLVTSSHIVSSTTFFSFHRERAPTFLSSSADAMTTEASFVMCFQYALFNTAWVAEMCAKQFAFKRSSIYSRFCRALRVLPDASVMKVSENDVADVDDVGMITAGSLFATPSGFSSLQYVRAAIDMAGDGIVLGSEQRFLLSIACSRSMQEVLELLERRLSQRPYTPLCVQSLLAAWNTLLIHSVELHKKRG
ncbi:DNA repair and recombination protein RAD54, putative [Trypanosoma cruzi marinkellei]|uniref:DNA repair and recombination protein RAD54, putative n=1 Tax=Trypanosoma cruzi marinkellei TaxID=85056 RepID=K2NEA0_TRYCR|nr:DNA repair and recombination protein RAD54, putative [Trypanosoma cruzi marinkellei]